MVRRRNLKFYVSNRIQITSLSRIVPVYQNCVLERGLMGAYIKCRKERVALNDCLEYWNDDDEIIARAKKEYLEARSKYRRTGVSEDHRIKINNYIDEQEALQKESSQPS